MKFFGVPHHQLTEKLMVGYDDLIGDDMGVHDQIGRLRTQTILGVKIRELK